MFICQKCGNIYTEHVGNCQNCGNNNFINSTSYDLVKYKCNNCGSIYNFQVTGCNNCGSRDILKFNDGRQVVHRPGRYNIDRTKLGYGKVDTGSEFVMGDIIKIIIRIDCFITVAKPSLSPLSHILESDGKI